jgi:hypothetical protein
VQAGLEHAEAHHLDGYDEGESPGLALALAPPGMRAGTGSGAMLEVSMTYINVSAA